MPTSDDEEFGRKGVARVILRILPLFRPFIRQQDRQELLAHNPWLPSSCIRAITSNGVQTSASAHRAVLPTSRQSEEELPRMECPDTGRAIHLYSARQLWGESAESRVVGRPLV